MLMVILGQIVSLQLGGKVSDPILMRMRLVLLS